MHSYSSSRAFAYASIPDASESMRRAPAGLHGGQNRRRITFAVRSLACAMALLAADRCLAAGFPNVTRPAGEQTQLSAGQAARISGPIMPLMGRLAVIAYHQGYIFTIIEQPSSPAGSDNIDRAWDIADPANPVVVGSWNTYNNPSFNAHGFLQRGNILNSAYNFRVTSFGGPIESISASQAGISHLSGSRGSLYTPWDATTFWSYDATNFNATLRKRGVAQATWDVIGETGVIGHPIIIGNLLIYASDQSNTGVATYDISDPANPVLLDVLTGSVGGYWAEIWGHYIVFPDRARDAMQVVDFEDPTDLRLVADIALPSSDPMYVQFQDEFAFMDRYKVDMRTFQRVLTFDASIASTSQYALPIGNLVLTGGIDGTKGGMNIWSHQAAADTRPPTVAYHIPRSDQSNYPVGAPISIIIHETLQPTTVSADTMKVVNVTTGIAVPGTYMLAHNDIITFQPNADLALNTTYEVQFIGGGIKDAAGNGIEATSFRFSTGSVSGGNRPPSISALTSNAYPVAPGGSVTLTAAATDPEGGALQYAFDFGDGTPRTTWSSATTAVHTYAAEGHYTAAVQARDPQGSIALRKMVVTVLQAPVGPAPTASSPIGAVNATTAWTVNPDADSITAISTSTLALTTVGEKPVGRNPRSLAVAADGTVWVACRDSDRIDVVNASTGAIITSLSLPYGAAPEAIAMSPDKTQAFIALAGPGKLVKFNTATRLQTSEVVLGATPRAIAVSGDASRILVTRFISPASRGEVWSVPNSGAGLGTPVVIPLAHDSGPDSVSSGRGVPNYLTSVAISPKGNRAWVSAKKDNVNRGTFVNGETPKQDNTVRSIVCTIDLTTNTELISQRRDLDNSEGAAHIAFSPLGDYAFVAQRGNATVALYDTLSTGNNLGNSSLISRLGVGHAPTGVWIDPATNRLFVQNFMDRSVSILQMNAFLRTGGTIEYATAAPVNTVLTEKLSAAVLAGKRTFYHADDLRMSAEGYITCATCHLDGGSDERIWDFTNRGEGLRNTVTLLGRNGIAQGNVHWTANFDEIQDFEHDIRFAFGGDGFLPDFDAGLDAPLGRPKAGRNADLDALAAYVASLGPVSIPRSPFRNPDGTLTPEAILGRDVFFAQNCGSCHNPTIDYTDSTVGAGTLHNVGTYRTSSGKRLGGTIAGFDTPTLLGVWATAPYLHDGSAATLADVFSAAGGVVTQAETGTLAGATLSTMSNCHAGSGVRFPNSSATVTFANVDGGPGGTSTMTVRYGLGYGNTTLRVTVNGTLVSPVLPKNNADWNLQILGTSSFNVTLAPGNTNTISFSISTTSFVLDEFAISHPGNVSAAVAHQRVPTADRANLVAYLQQLDGAEISGLRAEFFDWTTALSTIPSLAGRTPTVTRIDSQINYASSSTAWTGLDSRFNDTFACRHTGLIYIPETGTYTFHLSSDDGSRLTLSGSVVINHDGLHSFTEKSSAPLNLAQGWHPITVEFFENGGGAGLVLRWTGPGLTKQIVPVTAFSH